jgi:hypothetical protein
MDVYLQRVRQITLVFITFLHCFSLFSFLSHSPLINCEQRTSTRTPFELIFLLVSFLLHASLHAVQRNKPHTTKKMTVDLPCNLLSLWPSCIPFAGIKNHFIFTSSQLLWIKNNALLSIVLLRISWANYKVLYKIA